MAFASYQKAARTLAGVAHALADAHGVDDQLTAEAEVMISAILSGPEHLPSVAARAGHWAPEMDEVADSLRAADLPTDMPRPRLGCSPSGSRTRTGTTCPSYTPSLSSGQGGARRQGRTTNKARVDDLGLSRGADDENRTRALSLGISGPGPLKGL
ncbi:DUF1932 domain-containing protein [Streptomyces cyaneofuscatus]|uniref:DUF1932 domain-containing protein n=1 Tax=Streptomyces cyaneofuscatus TaxID=66883 RepID=UPI003660FBB9